MRFSLFGGHSGKIEELDFKTYRRPLYLYGSYLESLIIVTYTLNCDYCDFLEVFNIGISISEILCIL